MAQPCSDIAVTAFQAIRERLTHPTLPGRALLLTPRLVVRESCGAYVTARVSLLWCRAGSWLGSC